MLRFKYSKNDNIQKLKARSIFGAVASNININFLKSIPKPYR